MKAVNILYQCDNNFAFMVGTSLTSLLINASKDVQYNVFLLTEDMSEKNRSRFLELVDQYSDVHCSFEFLDAKPCLEEVKSWDVPDHRGSYVTYYKLLIDRYMKNRDIDKIIHIGADTLVTGNLEELADFDFTYEGKKAPFAMNWSERLYHCHFRLNYRYAIAEMVYFNLPVWRKSHAEQRCIEFAKKFGKKYDSKDQDILNMEFQFEYAQLPLKYNVYGSTIDFTEKNKRRFNSAKSITDKEIKEAYDKPEIIHIPKTFLLRPHEIGSLEPLKDLWWEYLNKSPWKGMEPVNSGGLGAKEKVLRWIYIHTSENVNGWIYVMFRRYYGLFRAIIQPPYSRDIERIGEV